MKHPFPLRVKVITGIVVFVGLLSAVVFYLTAVRFHRMAEGVLAAQQSTQVKLAARLWDGGMPASQVAELWMADSTIQQMSFQDKNSREERFPGRELRTQATPLRTFHHDFETPATQVQEIRESHGILHRNGHLLRVEAAADRGRVELVFSTAVINRHVARLAAAGYWILAAVVLLAGLEVFLIDRRLSQVVREMIRTTGAIASGRLDLKLEIRTGDRLEELGEGFNRLALSLADRQAGIECAQRELSDTVTARTAELREERDRLSRILDNLPSAFILFDEALDITVASSAVERLTGMTPPLKGSRACLCPYIGQDTDACIVRQAQSKGEAIVGHQFQKDIDGQERTMEHSVFPVKDEGRIVGWLETITDITERVHQHRRLIKAERMSAVGGMAALLAHEVRNQLTSAKMLFQMDREARNLTESQAEHLGRAVDAIQGMEQMVEDLLAFAKPSPMRKEAVDLDELLSSAALQVKPMAGEASVAVEVVNQAGQSRVSLDVDKTRQALVNLLLNAIHAAGGGGVARLTVDWSRPEAEVSGPSQRRGRRRPLTATRFLAFVVDDTGSGVAAEKRSQVFEPFYTTRARGTGLGLATVKQIVKDYGGRVQIEDSPLGGARFVMIVPA